EKGTKGSGAGLEEKRGRQNPAKKNGNKNNPPRHNSGAHHGNQNAAKRCQESGATGDGGLFELLVDLNDGAADGSHPVGKKTSDVGDENYPDCRIDRDRKADIGPQKSQPQVGSRKSPRNKDQALENSSAGELCPDCNIGSEGGEKHTNGCTQQC